MERKAIFERSVEFATIPKWFTLFSYVVVERRVLTEEELDTELAGELCVAK